MTTKPKLSPTDKALISMLTENTGSSMCDSGDAYGRHHEHNQGRDFLAEPATKFRITTYGDDSVPEIRCTHNVFHWLRQRVIYDAKMTAKFNRFAKLACNKDSYNLELAEEFAKLHGHNRSTVNTYNGEDMLSQTLQYVYFETDDGCYVLLQIHGGCDVRGGYTDPKAFQVEDFGDLCDNARGTIWEDTSNLPDQPTLPGVPMPDDTAYWDTKDGCYWYRDGSSALPQLETYPVTRDPAERGNGKIYLDDDGVAYGPLFGGKLEAGF
jgi:hypothetical protein